MARYMPGLHRVDSKKHDQCVDTVCCMASRASCHL